MKLSSLIIVVSMSLVSISFFAQNKILDSNSKIKVLNLASFHMGETNDAHKTEYDENDPKNKKENQIIAAMLADFKPTVICVEALPKDTDGLNKSYQNFLKDPNMKFKNMSEVQLIAFELGRLTGVRKLYGIDHRMGYDYPKIDSLAKVLDNKVYLNYIHKAEKYGSFINEELSTLEHLKRLNTSEYLDYLINFNADMLTYVATKDNFEGANEAAEFYKRNLRMFSNLNQVPLKEGDRVFILMGGTHTAFFNSFIKRSPKYDLVPVSDYLK